MADLPYIKEAQEVKITGQDSTGTTVNYVGADANGNMTVSMPQVTGTDGSASPSNVLMVGGETPTATLEPLAVDALGNQIVVGNVASVTADSGNPIKIGAVYNDGSLPTPASGERVDLQTDLNGRLLVAAALLDGYKTTYSAAITGLTIAAAATDVFTITGSATKTIRVTKFVISGTQTTASNEDILILKRSTANTLGTSTNPTRVPHDSNNAAATATINAYTANPTLGTLVGVLRSNKFVVGAISSGGSFSATLNILPYDFGNSPSQAIVIRGTSQVLALNLNAQTLVASSLDIYIEWTEE